MKGPKVSFIIPTLNRERTLEACLKSISNQTYINKEIIVIDGGSRDGTLSTASKYGARIVLDNGSLGQARQRGVEVSTGDILGIFDSDIILPTKDWTEKAVAKFTSGSNVGVVWAINKAPDNSSIVARCYFLQWQARSKDFLKQTGKKLLVPGGNALVLRKALETAGGFDKTLKFGEDLDLGRRITKLGYEVVVFEEPIIHDTMWSLKEYTRKQFWGASSLASSDPYILSLCINWNNAETTYMEQSVALSAFKFIIESASAMITGLSESRDSSWLILPILLSIRTVIYGKFFLARKLKPLRILN